MRSPRITASAKAVAPSHRRIGAGRRSSHAMEPLQASVSARAVASKQAMAPNDHSIGARHCVGVSGRRTTWHRRTTAILAQANGSARVMGRASAMAAPRDGSIRTGNPRHDQRSAMPAGREDKSKTYLHIGIYYGWDEEKDEECSDEESSAHGDGATTDRSGRPQRRTACIARPSWVGRSR